MDLKWLQRDILKINSIQSLKDNYKEKGTTKTQNNYKGNTKGPQRDSVWLKKYEEI